MNFKLGFKAIARLYKGFRRDLFFVLVHALIMAWILHYIFVIIILKGRGVGNEWGCIGRAFK